MFGVKRNIKSALSTLLIGLLTVSFGLGNYANAQTATSPSAVATTSTQTAGTTINIFCLNFGKDYPTGQTIKAQGLANDRVRGALAYAISKNYITSNPYQVQLAVWNLEDNQPFHDTQGRGTTVAQEIVNNTGTTPTGNAGAVANLTLTNIQPATPDAFYGTATIQGNADTSGYPVGFLLPASAANFQNLVAVVATSNTPAAQATTTVAVTTVAVVATTVAVTVGSTATAAPSATVAPTATRAATATVAPTTVAPTATRATTATVAPTATAAATAVPTLAIGTGGQGGGVIPNIPASGMGGGRQENPELNLLTLLGVLVLVAIASVISFKTAKR